jgi:hypothetical protein
VAAFLGHVNTIPWRYFLRLSMPKAAVNGRDISVRAEGLVLEKDPDGCGIIEDILFAGQYDVCRIRIDDLSLTAYTSDRNLAVHDRVGVAVKQYMELEGE